MRKIKALIVDDEPDARELLKVYLEKRLEIELVGACKDGQEAIEQIKVTRPDIVFLDIEMPEVDGLEVVSRCEEPTPYFIFITAYNEYAIRAFEVNAVDYILKPYTESRLVQAIEKACQAIEHLDLKQLSQTYMTLVETLSKSIPQQDSSRKCLQKFAIKTSSRTVFVDVSEVTWIEAADQYVKIHTKDREYLLRDSMDNLEQNLDPETFFRTHRSSIVNIREVVGMDQLDARTIVLTLKDKTQVNLTISRKDHFQKLMRW